MVSILLDVQCCNYITAGLLEVPSVTEGDSECSFMSYTTGLHADYSTPFLFAPGSFFFSISQQEDNFIVCYVGSNPYVTETHILIACLLTFSVPTFIPMFFSKDFCIECCIIEVNYVATVLRQQQKPYLEKYDAWPWQTIQNMA